MTTLIASPTPAGAELAFALALSTVQPGDTIQLRGGFYAGTFDLRVPNVTIEPYPNEAPRLVGPVKPISGTKPAWLRIWPSAKGAVLRGLDLARGGDIADAKRWDDFGILIEAPNVTVDSCRLAGMCKGLAIMGRESLRPTVTCNHIGPTYQSCIVVGSSEGVIRAGLIAWNAFKESYIEDGIQFMPRQTGDTQSAEHKADISNLGMIVYQNDFRDLGENGIDLKGAALVVIERNIFRRTAGSKDGPLHGWNHDSPATIMRGANASSSDVIVRNNDLEENASGIRVYERYHVYHNQVANNNYSPEGAYDGFGISQIDASGAIKNNLVTGHKRYNVQVLDKATAVERNPSEPGLGMALTYTVGAGSGRRLPLRDAGYFTDWFGRGDLPADVIWLNAQRFEVRSVEGDAIVLDRDTEWHDGDPVFWRSPIPEVGIQETYTPPVEPPAPPVDPPTPPEPTDPPEPTTPEEPTDPPVPQPKRVWLTVSVEVEPGAAAAVRAALESLTVTVGME